MRVKSFVIIDGHNNYLHCYDRVLRNAKKALKKGNASSNLQEVEVREVVLFVEIFYSLKHGMYFGINIRKAYLTDVYKDRQNLE